MKEVLKLSQVRIDGGTQPRAKIDTDTVSSYAECYKTKAALPSPIVFFDGAEYWLGDGFHRFHGASQAELKKIEFEVRKGTKRDAVLFSCGANATHGLPRSNADKRKAVMTLLKDAEWVKSSDRWIADTCVVSNHLVADCRKELEDSTGSSPSSNGRKGRDGKKRNGPKKPGKKRVKPAEDTTSEESDGDEEELTLEPTDEDGNKKRPIHIVKNDARLAIQKVCRFFDELGIYSEFQDVLQDLQNEVQKVRG